MVVQTGTAARLDPMVVEQFLAGIRGPVFQPGDAAYEDARKVQNGLIDRHPALIVQCSGVADIVACVTFAREQGLLLSVRGGGHNVAGNAVNDGGLVIDLSGMRSVQVDPVARTARVQGGATWGDLDRETQLFGLAAPGGVISTTGVGGLTLHGGFGWLRRKYGYSIDSLLSVEVVTADGQVRTASASQEPELFWAVRGAGGNFGVVTAFEFQLHPVPHPLAVCAVAYALEDGERVLTAWQEFMASAPEEISSTAIPWSVPPAPIFPEALHNRPIVILAAVHCGPPEVGEAALRPLRELAEPVLDLSGVMPYVALQGGFDGFYPKGRNYYWKSLYLDRLDAATLAAVLDRANKRPNHTSSLGIWHLGGAPARVAEDATAFANRDAAWLLTFETMWDEDDPETAARNIAWTRESWDMLQAFSTGGLYLNFPGISEGQTERDAIARAGYGTNYARLAYLKAHYDPDNLFRMNQNVVPAR